jgi:hypothetical protein
MSWLALAKLCWSLAPELRGAIAALVKALQSGSAEDSRRAYEAAHRVAFAARQK